MKRYNSRAVQKYLQTERTDKTMSKTTTKRCMGLLLALVMVFTMLPLSALAATDEPPSEPKFTKTAEQDPNKVNVFDVVLGMEARTTEPQSCDVVLVTDRSGSMGANNRMQSAINAGKTPAGDRKSVV